MAKIFVHALAATAGGGATYLRNLVHYLPEFGGNHQWLVMVPAQAELSLTPRGDRDTPARGSIQILKASGKGPLGRLYFDQVGLRHLVRRERVDLVLATGNFGMVRPPVPQILLNRNPLYFSDEYVRQLRRRNEFGKILGIVLRRRLTMACIRDSEVNIFPTAAFADIVRQWMPRLSADRCKVIPHGFDHDRFVRPEAKLDPELADRFRATPGTRRILMVSHYNYFRNFEILLRAFAELRASHPEPVELLLTTRLGPGLRDHDHDTTLDARLLAQLNLGDSVTMLGNVTHAQLYPLYRAADLVVCPAYAETFGHPMVEAMASERPIVAADCGVQREICGPAATYFPVFDARAFAARMSSVLLDHNLANSLIEQGRARVRDFCWRKHFRDILSTVDEVLSCHDFQPRAEQKSSAREKARRFSAAS